jgi:integrase
MADQKRGIGYYRKRGKDSYEIEYRRNRKTVIAKDDREAEKALAKLVAEVESGKFRKSSKMTVKELSDRFIRDNPDISPLTKDNYKIHLEDRILPALGHKKIDKVIPTDIYDFLNNLREDGIRKDGKPGGLGPASIQKIFHVLSSMFSFAVDLGELDDNPCVKVKPPKIPKRKKASIDRDPAREMLRALKNESLKYRCITLIAATTGERRGEILGLGDSTLDLENCTITIERASRHSKGDIALGDPKSETSKRIIPFDPVLVPLLAEMILARNTQRNKCGDKWIDKIMVHGELVDNDLLFTQWNGKPMHPNTIDSWFRKFREDNNLPETLKFHGLRHTNITQLLKAGVDIGTVADNSGHARKSTTLSYDDPDAEALREVANKISNVFDLKNIVPDLLGQPVNVYRKKQKAFSE